MEALKGCYLLLGDDTWSKNQFIASVKKTILSDSNDLMNYYEAKDKEVEVSKIENAIETLPFFAEKKLIYLKETGFFKPGKKDESERFEKVLKALPEYVVLLIDEKEVDKRGKLYKCIQKNGSIQNFAYEGEEAAFQYFKNEAQKEAIQIQTSVLLYFVQHMPEDMNTMRTEWQKLLSYCHKGSIEKADIDAVCVFSLETRVFEMVKKMTRKEADEALQIYERLIQSKESPIGILVLIARQYRMMLQVKYLSAKKQSSKEIASLLKIPYFAVKEIQNKVKQDSFAELEKALAACLETDRMIKTGQMDAAKAVEWLIINGVVS